MNDQRLNDLRAKDAKAKSDFYSGHTDTHPHGLSGLKWILPPETDNCSDTSPNAYRFSEWGNLAGIVW